jgi:hypothetical protein
MIIYTLCLEFVMESSGAPRRPKCLIPKRYFIKGIMLGAVKG